MDKQVAFFNGYQKIPSLWKKNQIFDFKQFEIKNTTITLTNSSVFTNQRLGKLVEQFVGFQLRQQDDIELLEENIQIRNEKQTIGELDALFLNKGKPIHLEIVYKFYLYDTLNDYADPLAYWIGPNRKDTLLYKLEKLKYKQLPLLYHPLTQLVLDKHNIKASEIEQNVCFKAQLFLPFKKQMSIAPLNKDCISGWHLPNKDICVLKDYQFYIPEKLEWLIQPHLEVKWLDYNDVKVAITELIKLERSPMCWLKNETNAIVKCFITFW